MKLEREFYQSDVLNLAKKILGKILVHRTDEGVIKGRIVEVEAYNGAVDKAAHSYPNLKTARTQIQFGQGGYLYVFLIYGMHICINIVVNGADKPEVLLVRALEPVEGIELMEKNRGTHNVKNLCNGPGKLSKAMGITKAHYGIDLCGDEIYIEDAPDLADEEIETTKRINIDYAEEAIDYLWRFTVKGNQFLSKTSSK